MAEPMCSCGCSRENRCAGAQAAIENDHAVACDEPKASTCNRGREILRRELTQRFNQPEKSARAASLSHRELSAACVDRKASRGRELVSSNELGCRAFG